MLDDFHFLRPWWLLALVPAALLLWLIWRAADSNRQWRKVIAPHLLPHLVGNREQASRLRPFGLLVPIWLLSILALAGPAWEKESSPFSTDSAALVIVFNSSKTMLAQDIQPSRLQRAVHKIGDLLDRRQGTRTALISYAGSAHLVMPLTEDSGVIVSMAAEISPEIMPLPEGDAAAAAVELGLEQLERSGLPGSVLLFTDAVDPNEQSAAADACRKQGVPLHVYAIAAPAVIDVPPDSPPAPPLDAESLRRLSRSGGGSLVIVTPDEEDVVALANEVTTKFGRSKASAEAEGEHWKDYGYWLLPLLVLLSLFWSRPGWSVRWPGTLRESSSS